MKKENNLIAPHSYWQNSSLPYINGCGGKGINSTLIPDSLFGVDINEACNIHDYMYEEGKNRNKADKLFLKNMITIINQDSNSKILNGIRKVKAYLYYMGVKLFGNFFFNKKS